MVSIAMVVKVEMLFRLSLHAQRWAQESAGDGLVHDFSARLRAYMQHWVIALCCAFGRTRLGERIEDCEASTVDDEAQQERGPNRDSAQETLSAKQAATGQSHRLCKIGHFQSPCARPLEMRLKDLLRKTVIERDPRLVKCV
jgi:hypothetical protein